MISFIEQLLVRKLALISRSKNQIQIGKPSFTELLNLSMPGGNKLNIKCSKLNVQRTLSSQTY